MAVNKCGRKQLHPISVDFETKSRIEISRGVHNYTMCPEFEVLCASFRWGLGEGESYLWHPGLGSLPQWLQDYARQGGAFSAFNAAFERNVWNRACTRLYGWPFLHLEQWHCAAARAAVVGAPRKLEHIPKWLGIDVAKDIEGGRLMKQLTKPDSKTGKFRVPTPADLQRLYEYCEQDTYAERFIAQYLPPMTDSERQVWLLDQQMNERGLLIDQDLARAAIELWRTYESAKAEEFKRLTGFAHTQVLELSAWISKFTEFHLGKKITSCADDVLRDLQDAPELQHETGLMQAMKIRREIGSAATKKFQRMLTDLSSDGRLRGGFRYYGAGTGRWSGNGVQPQNLSSGFIFKSKDELGNPVDELPSTVQQVKQRDPAVFQNPLGMRKLLASMVRPCLTAAPGKRYVTCDLAQIEARVLAWEAGQQDLIAAFAAGEDVYVPMGAAIFGIPNEAVGKKERDLGKSTVLGCGFQMAAPTFQKNIHKKSGVLLDLQLVERAVTTYRQKNPDIVSYWYHVQDCVVQAVVTQSIVPTRNSLVTMDGRNPDWLLIWLPSGRPLWYFRPTLSKEVRHGRERTQVKYWNSDSGGNGYWTRLYGGIITENIVQATARDIMVHGMLNCEAAGYPVVLTLHDEAVTEVPIGQGSAAEMDRLMSHAPSWAAGCPLAAEADETPFYRK